jgi:hypothetical protein
LVIGLRNLNRLDREDLKLARWSTAALLAYRYFLVEGMTHPADPSYSFTFHLVAPFMPGPVSHKWEIWLAVLKGWSFMA